MDKHTLERWYDMLDRYDVTEVMDEIRTQITKIEVESRYNAMNDASTDAEVKTLEFHEIVVGETYKFASVAGLKSYLQGKKVKIIEKKIKNVIGELLEGAGKYSKGTKVNISPNALVRL